MMYLEERRKELIGEGHRMFDLLRNNLRVTRINETDDMMKEAVHFDRTKHNTAYMEYRQELLPYNIYFLFLKKEMDANPNIVQTPEYQR